MEKWRVLVGVVDLKPVRPHAQANDLIDDKPRPCMSVRQAAGRSRHLRPPGGKVCPVPQPTRKTTPNSDTTTFRSTLYVLGLLRVTYLQFEGGEGV